MKRFICLMLTAFFLISQVAFAADVTIFRWGWPAVPSLKTGQTTSYHADDDGDLELGVVHNYTILTTGQYAGFTDVTINGKTHVTSNACVQDLNTGNMFLREIIQADIGPANDGKLFWDQFTLSAETVTFTAADGKITADVGTPFSTTILCPGRKFTVVDSGAGNDGTYTVSAITTSVITTVEGVANEASISIDFATVDDLIWNLKDQANSGSGLAGYTDWRIPNRKELESIVDLGQCNPTIDGTAFPSTPTSEHWSSSTNPCNQYFAWTVEFNFSKMHYNSKQANKYYIRLVRN